MGNNSIVRKHIIFYGYVQGVGFRYRARHAADLYGCTGWVKNEWDGSVSMEIQGEESQIDQVILAIGRGTYVPRHAGFASAKIFLKYQYSAISLSSASRMVGFPQSGQQP